VEDKAEWVRKYHEATIHSLLELVAAAGLDGPNELDRSYINKRVGLYNVLTYAEIYPYMSEGSLLDIADIPENYKRYFQLTRIMK
jgi:hypothetical protein